MQPKPSNVVSTIEISIASPTAMWAAKLFALSDTRFTTFMAGFAGIARLYEHQWNSSRKSLVSQELS